MKYTRPREMPDGTLVYPHRGFEPPPLIPGYRRKSNNPRSGDAWVMIPEWQDCKYRCRIELQKTTCRCLTFAFTCNHPDYVGPHLSAEICKSCPLKDLS